MLVEFCLSPNIHWYLIHILLYAFSILLVEMSHLSRNPFQFLLMGLKFTSHREKKKKLKKKRAYCTCRLLSIYTVMHDEESVVRALLFSCSEFSGSEDIKLIKRIINYANLCK